MADWFETFFHGIGKKAVATSAHPEAARRAAMVKKLLRVRKGMRVLDVPCGAGRLTLPMAKMGVRMTGVDLCSGLIRKARREAKKQDLDIRFMKRDMRAIEFDAEFDAVFNYGGSFGYFSDEDNLEVCKRMLKALKPGGRFLIEGLNKSWMLSHFKPVLETTMGPVKARVHNRFDPRTGRSHAKWILTDGKTEETRESHMWIFNGTEIRRLLRKAGFRKITLHGWPPVGRLTRHSRRLMAVAARPKK